MADQDPAAPGSPSTAPRLAHDLLAIRENRDVSLDDMQRETRMPSDILKRLEAGDLIGDPHYNEVYLRNLLKSYAQAISVSPQEVMAAYEQVKQGTYDGSLRKRYVEGETAEEDATADAAPASQAAKEREPVKEDAPNPSGANEKKPPTAKSGAAPAVAALSTPPKKPTGEEKPKAGAAASMPKQRVTSATAASQPLEKSWTIIIAGTVVVLCVIGGILWFLFRDTSPDPEPVAAAPTSEDTTQAEPSEDAEPDPEPPPSSAPSFQRPIQLTVEATDAPLENFRVQVDDDARRPYWVEPGQSTSFTAQSEIRVWGELEQGGSGGGNYDGARLQLQGLEWAPQDGRVVVIDADRGQAFLDSLARAGANRIGASG